MNYPIRWYPVSQELETQRSKSFNQTSTMIRAVVSDPFEVHLPEKIREIAEKIYNFPIRSSDVWIMTYPKCGTTWMQVIKSYSVFHLKFLYIKFCERLSLRTISAEQKRKETNENFSY